VANNAWRGGHKGQLRQLARELAEEFENTQRLVDACR
jgi:hypothetical protein